MTSLPPPPPPPPPPGWATPVPGPPPPGSTGALKIVVIVGVVLALVAVVCVVAVVLLGRSVVDNAAIPELEVGMCVDIEEVDQVVDTETVDCQTPHDAEVYRVAVQPDGPDAPYPSEVELAERLDEVCVGDYGDYVGRDYFESELDYYGLYPSPETWARLDDRELVCMVVTIDGTPLDPGSVEDSAR